MKKRKILMIMLCIALAFSLTMMATACGNSGGEPAEEPVTEEPVADEPVADEPAADDSADKPLVGISVPNNPTGWVGAVQWTAKKKADELGLNYQLVTSNDPNDQANKIDDLINMGCKYIVLFPENDELAVAAQKVKDAGIPLIDFDRTLGDTTPDYYVAGDNKGMGVIGAEYIIEKLEGKGGKVAIMNIPNYGSIFTERVDGAMSVFDKTDNIEVIGTWASDNGAPETVLPVMKDVLTANPQIDAIYSTDDEMSMGILQAIKEAGRTDVKVITGGGGWKDYFNIMNDYPDIWVCSQTYAPYMMNDCLDIVQKLINGETVPEKTIIPPLNVDRTNYEQYLADNGITEDAPY
ncbi:MAG: substrate-binding domain-containing protein [Clostridiales Family XIII bacterium]|jgi:ribose transport system substrate-binding protein|nr:substrate-binding domain-containing protein [Clostridiales Family XIII bacterium]